LQLKHVSAIGNKLVTGQYLLHTSSQYGELWPLTPEVRWWLWGIPTNFNGFRVLASLLHRHRSTKVSQTMFGRLLGWYTIQWESKNNPL